MQAATAAAAGSQSVVAAASGMAAAATSTTSATSPTESTAAAASTSTAAAVEATQASCTLLGVFSEYTADTGKLQQAASHWLLICYALAAAYAAFHLAVYDPYVLLSACHTHASVLSANFKQTTLAQPLQRQAVDR